MQLHGKQIWQISLSDTTTYLIKYGILLYLINSVSFLASHPEQLHKLPSADFNAIGEYISANKLIQSGSVEFDEFISGELFEDAIQDEELLDPSPDDNFEFLMSDADYSHQQTLIRCMYAAREIIANSDFLLAF